MLDERSVELKSASVTHGKKPRILVDLTAPAGHRLCPDQLC